MNGSDECPCCAAPPTSERQASEGYCLDSGCGSWLDGVAEGAERALLERDVGEVERHAASLGPVIRDLMDRAGRGGYYGRLAQHEANRAADDLATCTAWLARAKAVLG